ncbi:hypothetical protein B8W69_19915 [Mycobacterium vulneris]|jgi:hypothetical protein|uniref:DUF732 domain-containing protein n=1 Tax=Mycolicibacterium vulneris TaxID=547163 RepID=A0A1X2KV79_9MYCO|nr:DUF732 domain-containing protein [Mycolicibacterium vulneris]OSC25193.1 hypothetical protein B8W69_19915 [Mycolicibacterium vulneris]
MTAAELNAACTDAAYRAEIATETVGKSSGSDERPQSTRQRLHRKGLTIPVVCGLTVAAVMTIVAAPLARAEDADALFLNAMRGHGISSLSGTDQDLIKVGRSVCDLLGGGYSINAVIDLSKRISDEDPTYFVRTSAETLCPQLIH